MPGSFLFKRSQKMLFFAPGSLSASDICGCISFFYASPPYVSEEEESIKAADVPVKV